MFDLQYEVNNFEALSVVSRRYDIKGFMQNKPGIKTAFFSVAAVMALASQACGDIVHITQTVIFDTTTTFDNAHNVWYLTGSSGSPVLLSNYYTDANSWTLYSGATTDECYDYDTNSYGYYCDVSLAVESTLGTLGGNPAAFVTNFSSYSDLSGTTYNNSLSGNESDYGYAVITGPTGDSVITAQELKNFTTTTSGYIAFTFTYGGGTQYGWASVELNATSHTFTITEWAYTTNGSSDMTALESVPEPAAAAGGLGLIALCAAGFRRIVKGRRNTSEA